LRAVSDTFLQRICRFLRFSLRGPEAALATQLQGSAGFAGAAAAISSPRCAPKTFWRRRLGISTAVADVEVVGARKSYGEVVAVDDVDLHVGPGEFFTLLGPSGSGKTTTLRLIAGFERPDAGRVSLAGVDITDRPPYARDVNTVFQDYALFPHMTVAENVGYGLRVKGTGRAERARAVEEVLATVRLEGYGKRKPVQLSGGQRQRVALARAIVNRPRVLLLDEPLGALDLKLRQEMQVFLKSLQRDLGMTFVYVTHDQEEALTMSDRIAVFNHGRIEQVGEPAEVYDRPASEFVAGFVGTSNIVERDGRRLCIRPERIALGNGGEPATVDDVVFVGAFTRYLMLTDKGERLTVVQQSDGSARGRGERVGIGWRDEDAFQLPGEGR
jgi:putative spermidine/putrescine transport system ATP-binding protein